MFLLCSFNICLTILVPAFIPFTLFPYLSRGGDTSASPPIPGKITNIPPPTPDFAGIAPTLLSQVSENS